MDQHIIQLSQPWVAEPLSKWEGTSAHQKAMQKFLWFELEAVTSQTLKYVVLIYTPLEGLNFTILDKNKPL